MKNIRFYILFAVLNIIPSMLFSQATVLTGMLTGSVIDEIQREPMIGANVIVLGTSYGAATDEKGAFVIKNIPLGTYSVRAEVIGYKPVTLTDIVVSPVKPQKLSFFLNESIIEFAELTVQQDYFSESTDNPISAKTQTNEEIRRLPGGFEDVVRAVSILPGVAQVQAGRNDLIVRGGAPSENLNVIDGIEIANINHFGTQGATGGPLSFINLDFVRNTTFSTGGFGVKYGDKLSSVLTVDLRSGREDRMGGKATISATQFGLNLEGPVTQKGSWLFSARKSYLDLIFKAAKFGFVPEYWDFLGKADYNLDQNNKLAILFVGAIDRTNFFNDSAEKRYDNSTILGNTQNQALGGISWRHTFRGGFSTLSLSQTIVDFRFFQNDTLLNPLFRNNSIERETTLKENIVYHFGKTTELTAGALFKAANLNSDILLSDFTDDYGARFNLTVDQNKTLYKSAGWLQIAQDFNRLKLIAGIRGDYFNYIRQKGALSPRLSAEYAISNLTSLDLCVGQYTQSPSYVWLLANSQNRELKYIKVNQYIAGIKHNVREDTRISVEVYYKDYSHYPASISRPYLVMANTGAGFGGSEDGYASFGFDPLTSAGNGHAAGVEFFTQKKLSTVPLYGLISISFNEAKFKGLDGINRYSSFDQRWIVNLGGGYVFNRSWEVSGKTRFVTGRPYTPYNQDLSKSSEFYNSVRINNNYHIDLRVDKRWFSGRVVYITYIDLQNITNFKAFDVPRYNSYTNEMEERNGIGFLPSIGVSAEF